MKKKNLSQSTLVLAVLTLITILVWVGFDVYRAYTKTRVRSDVRKQMIPINPELDIGPLQKLEETRDISFEEISGFRFLPVLNTSREATEEASPKQATASGQSD